MKRGIGGHNLTKCKAKKECELVKPDPKNIFRSNF
jgi:hypothetical protein